MADLIEIGAVGLRQFGGRVDEEFLVELQGPRGAKVYREMASNDAVVGATLYAIKMLIRRTSMFVAPLTSDTADQEAAAFVESCRGDMSHSWGDFLRDTLSFLDYGWAYHEEVYKLRKGQGSDPTTRSQYTDGRIGWRKLPIRAQTSLTRWAFDPEGSLMGMHQAPAPSYSERLVPIEKSLLFRAGGERGNPEGRSILRTMYRSWYFGKRIEEIEAVGIERDLAGLPVVTVPAEWMGPTATDEQKNALEEAKKIATSIRLNEHGGLVKPAMYDAKGNDLFKVELMTSGGKRAHDTDAIIARYDQRKAMAVLCDFLLLGHDKVGSNSLGITKAEIFTTAIETFLGDFTDVFNRFAIPRLLGLNGMKGRCELRFGEVDRVDIAELGDYIGKLSGAHVLLSDDELGRYTRKVAGLPEVLADAAVGKRRSFPQAAREALRARVAKDDRAAEAPIPEDPTLEIADQLAPALRKRFLQAVAATRGHVDLAVLADAIEAKDLTAAEAATAIESLAAELVGVLDGITVVLSTAGVATTEFLAGSLGTELVAFNVRSPRVAAWVEEHGAELVKDVTENQRAAIRERLAEVMEDGSAPKSAAKIIREHIGQTEPASRAIRARETEWRANGLTDAQVERKVSQYADAKLADRADTISNHEALTAAGRGRLESWQQAQAAGYLPANVRRRPVPGEDDRTCPICEPFSDEDLTFGLAEPIVSPYDGTSADHTPLHILCRCPEVLVFVEEDASAEPLVPVE